MIPKKMEGFLTDRLPEQTRESRLVNENGGCFMEFSSVDVDRLARLGIEIDSLGPHLVVCMWDEKSTLEVGGYLVVDNLAMGRAAMGGIRMLPDITPAAVFSLARGMTMKNAASGLPFGGGKVGIIAERSLTQEEHSEVVRRFARLLRRYLPVFLPGPDVGTTDADMKWIAIENGLDTSVSKPADMGGSRAEQAGAAAGGLVIALKALLREMPRLKSLPQFTWLEIPNREALTVLIQGFGAVGANTANQIEERIPGAKVIGISDALGYLYDPKGLPIDDLFRMYQERVSVSRPYFMETLISDRWGVSPTKYCSASNELLRKSAFCLIPASPISNYLDLTASTQPSITSDEMGDWALIIEGANTYSPERFHRSSRLRMEREVYGQRGVLIVPDFLVNSGAVIFAAQEQLIKTPEHLRIPDAMLGDRSAVERWLAEHAQDLRKLADKRRKAGEVARHEVIEKNMRELVDQLVKDPDMLPTEAAELISIRRVAQCERDRTAREIMMPMAMIGENCTIREAANLMMESKSSILAVLDTDDRLVGVVTAWDVTSSTAKGISKKQPLSLITTREVVSAAPNEDLLCIVRKLEHQEITAMPVVEDEHVLGMVSSDLLAQRSLLRLLQTQSQ